MVKNFEPVISVCKSYFFYSGLNKLIACLDRRYTKELAGKKSTAFKALPRIVRSPAKLLPKANAPDWALKPTYRQREASSTSGEQQELTSTPVSSADARSMSSRQLSFSEISDETVISSSDVNVIWMEFTLCFGCCIIWRELNTYTSASINGKDTTKNWNKPGIVYLEY